MLCQIISNDAILFAKALNKFVCSCIFKIQSMSLVLKKGNELEKEKHLVSKSTITYLKNTKG